MRAVLMFTLSLVLAQICHSQSRHDRYPDCDGSTITVPEWNPSSLPLPPDITPRSADAVRSLTDQRSRFHVVVASSTTPAGTSHDTGGLYVLTSRNMDCWNSTDTIFTNNGSDESVNDSAIATSPAIACNDRKCSPYYLHVYVVFLINYRNSDGVPDRQLAYVRSVDGGNTFREPRMRMDIDGGIPISPQMSVDDNDRVTVKWLDSKTGKILSRTSPNGLPVPLSFVWNQGESPPGVDTSTH